MRLPNILPTLKTREKFGWNPAARTRAFFRIWDVIFSVVFYLLEFMNLNECSGWNLSLVIGDCAISFMQKFS